MMKNYDGGQLELPQRDSAPTDNARHKPVTVFASPIDVHSVTSGRIRGHLTSPFIGQMQKQGNTGT
jgi:hypothetical protein